MMLILSLAFFGLFLIYLEFFFPSGIAAVLAVVSLLGSLILFILRDEGVVWSVAYGVFLLALSALICVVALLRVKKRVVHQVDQEGYTASTFDKDLIGLSGTCLTDLKPAGYILIQDKSYSAYSIDGYIHKNASITVVGGKGCDLQVKRS